MPSLIPGQSHHKRFAADSHAEKILQARVESRLRRIHKRDEDRPEPSWVDRTAPRPEAAAINHELLEIVQGVIPDLPTEQQRNTAAWMIERILNAGNCR